MRAALCELYVKRNREFWPTSVGIEIHGVEGERFTDQTTIPQRKRQTYLVGIILYIGRGHGAREHSNEAVFFDESGDGR